MSEEYVLCAENVGSIAEVVVKDTSLLGSEGYYDKGMVSSMLYSEDYLGDGLVGFCLLLR